MSDADRHTTAIAAQQLGLVSMDQAFAAGLSPGQVQRRVQSGAWTRIARGVYRIAGAPETWDQAALAACLSRPGAVVSRLTAARVHDLTSSVHPLPSVTVPMGTSSRVSAARTHRARLTPIDICQVGPIPVTTIERTLVDCAEMLGPRRLCDLVDAAMHTKRITARSVDDAWERAERAPGRRGRKQLERALVAWRNPVTADLAAEVRLIRILHQWGFPDPERQIPIIDRHGTTIARVDLGWSPQRVGIEYDSERWHGPDRWQADETRHRSIEAAGWSLLRADKLDLRPGRSRLREALERAWPTAA